MRARSFLAVVLLSLGSTAPICAHPARFPLPQTERIAILDNSAKSLYSAENALLNPESRIGLLCHNDPVNKVDPDGRLAWFLAIPLWMAADWAYDKYAAEHVNKFVDDNFSSTAQQNIRAAGNVADTARTLKNPAKLAAKSMKTIKKEWSQKHTKAWPTDTKTGRSQDGHHKQPKADGGAHDADNIEPKPRDEHIKHHKDNDDFRRWGKRRDANG
jgi:hypothetical protein